MVVFLISIPGVQNTLIDTAHWGRQCMLKVGLPSCKASLTRIIKTFVVISYNWEGGGVDPIIIKKF